MLVVEYPDMSMADDQPFSPLVTYFISRAILVIDLDGPPPHCGGVQGMQEIYRRVLPFAGISIFSGSLLVRYLMLLGSLKRLEGTIQG
jgi:hypothetical protein